MLYLCNEKKCEKCNKEYCYCTTDRNFKRKVKLREPLNSMNTIERLRWLANNLLDLVDGKQGNTEFEEACVMLDAANALEYYSVLGSDQIIAIREFKDPERTKELEKILGEQI